MQTSDVRDDDQRNSNKSMSSDNFDDIKNAEINHDMIYQIIEKIE